MTKQFDITRYELESGKLTAHTWPGGYPVFYLVADSGVLCPTCANENRELTTDPDDKQWYIVAADINYEDAKLTCDHCNNRIASAYA
jgi:hypothetical protein